MRRGLLAAAALAVMASLAGCDRPTDKGATNAGSVDTTIAAAPAPQAPAATPPETAASSEAGADASSVEARYSPAYDACMSSGEAAEGVTVAMADCTSAEIEVQDAKLNAAYQQAMRGLEEGPRQKLREAQRAWIKFRDTKCASEANSGGTMDILNSGGCILDATVRRTIELEAMGDVG
jgi:uncharacterized protein YecT (DUF1311 family)